MDSNSLPWPVLKPPLPVQGGFFVYILLCDNGTLYVGSTNAEHLLRAPDRAVVRERHVLADHPLGGGADHLAEHGRVSTRAGDPGPVGLLVLLR